jgi:hypothetical protein
MIKFVFKLCVIVVAVFDNVVVVVYFVTVLPVVEIPKSVVELNEIEPFASDTASFPAPSVAFAV